MKRVVVSIILIFTILNISSFFIMQSRAPMYTEFTGAVHYPSDYLYYLSYITQGKEHWIMGENLKSGETTSGALVNWMYVLGGHIGGMFGISPIWTYQLLVIVASILYLSVSYLLFSRCFPKQPMTRLVAWILFLLSNAFPKITHTAQGWDFGFYYPFNNLGHPFVRLSNVPHHTLIQASIMAAFVVTIDFWHKHTNKKLIILLAIGMILGSMQPLQWAFVTGVIGLYGLFYSVIAIRKKIKGIELMQPLFPAVALSCIGLPAALYIQQLYSGPLYTYMLAWEKNQQVFIPFVEFIKLHGPVMLIGVLSFPFTIRKLPDSLRVVWLYAVISLVLFFSPLPTMIGILNLRFLSVIPIVVAAYSTAELLRRLTFKIPGTLKYPALWLCAFVVLAITIPVTYAHVALGRPNAQSEDINTYLPLGAYQVYKTATTVIRSGDTTLVTPLFAQSFPAFTGRHVYDADIFGTINFSQKRTQSERFFAKSDSPDIRMKWLKDAAISYIFTYAWTPINDLENLQVVTKNEYAILYRVVR